MDRPWTIDRTAVAWILITAAALWWPNHLAGLLDGSPFESATEAICLGLMFATLTCFHPTFLQRTRPRVVVILLILWKAFTATTLVQDGWCVSLQPSRPYVRDGTGRPHSWDVRADWRSADPECSAIATRSYASLEEFPVWFFNLPAANGDTPRPGDVPPEAITKMTMRGYLTVSEPGTLRIETSPTVTATLNVDGVPATSAASSVPAGTHAVVVDAVLADENWRFEPKWNDEDLWSEVVATVQPPSAIDLWARPWGDVVGAVLVVLLLGEWCISALALVFSASWLIWATIASLGLILTAAYVPELQWHYAVATLMAACVLPRYSRASGLRSLFLLVGVPWLSFVVAANIFTDGIARFTMYSAGNDYWLFQRFAYRIFLQGYWLEGGEPAFWFQPLYRWIAGALHMIVGDWSIGEEFWDGTGVFVMAAYGFCVVQTISGWRWGMATAGLVLAAFMSGPGLVFVGRGLSEISSALFIYLAALCVLRSRRHSWRAAVAAGVLALLGIWARLNNLPMALGVVLFAWPLDREMRLLRQPAHWFDGVDRRVLLLVPATIAIGMLLFALRTYYYTGVFSVFFGTQGAARSVWEEGMPAAQVPMAVLGSLAMVLTTTDPPHVHVGALPLILGAVLSAAAISSAGVLGQLPLAPTLFCLTSFVGAVLVRGSAYPGRFSIHVIGAAVTVLMAVCALSWNRLGVRTLGAVWARQ